MILVAELRNGMQLANLGGDTQNIVIGVLLLAAIIAGNVTRAAQGGAIVRSIRLRKEVIGTTHEGRHSADPWNLRLERKVSDA